MTSIAYSDSASTLPGYFFTRLREHEFAPTRHAEGAWSPEDYHFAAIAGLMVHELERHRAAHCDPALQLSRIAYDILGRLPFGNVEVSVEVLRPGRTIELMEATATIGGRSVITARAWYLIATADNPAGNEYEALTPPEDCPPRSLQDQWGGGFINQTQARAAREYRPGRSAAWLRSDQLLVAGEEPNPTAQYLCLVDVANGVAVREHPADYAFPNVDLTVHLFRQPDPAWTGVDTRVSWGPNGLGITDSVLHDIHGPVGTAVQSLTVRKL